MNGSLNHAHSRLRAAAEEVEAELRLRASNHNAIGQIHPPYTAHSLLSMAELLRKALDEDGSEIAWEEQRER